MRFVIVGLGSIGRRHLRNLRALRPDAHIVAVRHTKTSDPPPDGADEVVYSLRDAAQRAPDAALICGPTAHHRTAAEPLAAAGAHLFVEKPLAATPEDARAVFAAAAGAGRVLAVGYNLRFSPSLRAFERAVRSGIAGRVMSVRAEVGQYLPDWRPGVDYRTTNSARSDLGAGGVLFELSHEIDYVRWLCGEPDFVTALSGRLSNLEIDVDDTAEILLHFASGAIGSIHLDMAQRSLTRTCRIVGTERTLRWDAIDGTVYASEGNEWTTLFDGHGVARNDAYVDELTDFLAACETGVAPAVSGADGVRVVEIADAAQKSAIAARSAAL